MITSLNKFKEILITENTNSYKLSFRPISNSEYASLLDADFFDGDEKNVINQMIKNMDHLIYAKTINNNNYSWVIIYDPISKNAVYDGVKFDENGNAVKYSEDYFVEINVLNKEMAIQFLKEKDPTILFENKINENSQIEVQNDLVTISLDERGNNLSSEFSNGFKLLFNNLNRQNFNRGSITLVYIFNGHRIIQKIWTRYTNFNKKINPFAKAIEGYLENDEFEGAIYAMIKALKHEVQKTKDQGTNYNENVQKTLDALNYIDSKIPSEITFEHKINEDIMHGSDNIPKEGETVKSVIINEMKDQATITFSSGKKVMVVGDFNESKVNENLEFNLNDIKKELASYKELMNNNFYDVTTPIMNKNGNIKLRDSKNGDTYTISKNTGKILKYKFMGSVKPQEILQLKRAISTKEDLNEVFTFLLNKIKTNSEKSNIVKNKEAQYIATTNFSLPNYHIILNSSDKLLNHVQFKTGDEIKTSYQSGSLGDIWNVTNLNSGERATFWSYTYGLPKELKDKVKKIEQ